MQFSQTAQYALRVMAYIAVNREEAPFRAKDLSAKTGVPTPYLSKILRRLVETGLLNSQKGHGGGYFLDRPPQEIRFSDVLSAVDYEVEPATCMFGWGPCDIANPCPLHLYWSDLKAHYEQWAQRYTLADVEREAAESGPRQTL